MVIGVVGCGKMGSALTMGAIQAGVFAPAEVRAYDPSPQAIASLAPEITVVASLQELIAQVEVILLCVKPQDVIEVLKEVKEKNEHSEKLLILSIAAGVSLDTMEGIVDGTARIIRTMPNTPALVGKGAAAYSPGALATEQDRAFAHRLLSSVGIACEVKESLLDAVTGTSGSGPAYIYTLIEALADGALLQGIPRDQALQLATQTVLGAATMVSETGEHPAILRDRVTSPGGTTIAGLAALEKGAFRSSIIKAVEAATKRSQELGKN